MKKQSILFFSLMLLIITASHLTSNAQNTLLGFKSADKENKIEKMLLQE